MSELVEVAPVAELEPGERRLLTAGGHSIGVFNIDSELYAISNVCAHEGGPVCEGRLHGALVGEYTDPGDRIVEEFSDTPAIACPWHGWEYDVRSGEHLGDPDTSIPTFEVVVRDGTIYVEV